MLSRAFSKIILLSANIPIAPPNPWRFFVEKPIELRFYVFFCIMRREIYKDVLHVFVLHIYILRKFLEDFDG